MIKKLLIITALFYFLALLQTSFLVHFDIKGIVPNFVLLSVILINLFEPQKEKTGIFAAFIGGFFLDIWSVHIFGMEILILLAAAIFIKFIIKRYVQF